MQTRQVPPSPRVVLAALAAVVLWGGSAPATKLAVQTLPPLLVAILRTSLAGLAALPLVLALRLPVPSRMVGGSLRGVAVVTTCGFVAFPVLFSLGLGSTSASHGAMILALLPVATGAFAAVVDGRWPGSAWWAGCTLAVAGEAVLVFGKAGSGASEGALVGDALVLLSVLCGAAGNVAGGRLQRAGFPASAATLWGAAFATVLLVPALLWMISGMRWGLVAPEAWVGVAYLAFGATILGYGLWYWALGQGDIARVGLLQFLQPISGIILSWALLDERPTGTLILATVTILAGIAVATLYSRRR